MSDVRRAEVHFDEDLDNHISFWGYTDDDGDYALVPWEEWEKTCSMDEAHRMARDARENLMECLGLVPPGYCKRDITTP